MNTYAVASLELKIDGCNLCPITVIRHNLHKIAQNWRVQLAFLKNRRVHLHPSHPSKEATVFYLWSSFLLWGPWEDARTRLAKSKWTKISYIFFHSVVLSKTRPDKIGLFVPDFRQSPPKPSLGQGVSRLRYAMPSFFATFLHGPSHQWRYAEFHHMQNCLVSWW